MTGTGVVSLLIVYNRRTGHATRTPFDNSRDALRARFDYENEHGIDPEVEVVTLTASIDLMRRTHSKYFHDEL